MVAFMKGGERGGIGAGGGAEGRRRACLES